jgi:hypothetical protein
MKDRGPRGQVFVYGVKKAVTQHKNRQDKPTAVSLWIPVTDGISQSPGHEHALAARVFHLHRHALAARVFHLKLHAIVQALAARVFHLNHHATEQAFAARVIDHNGRNLAPRIFHLNHHVIGQALALIASSAL